MFEIITLILACSVDSHSKFRKLDKYNNFAGIQR